jgi:hypothetical protein
MVYKIRKNAWRAMIPNFFIPTAMISQFVQAILNPNTEQP